MMEAKAMDWKAKATLNQPKMMKQLSQKLHLLIHFKVQQCDWKAICTSEKITFDPKLELNFE